MSNGVRYISNHQEKQLLAWEELKFMVESTIKELGMGQEFLRILLNEEL
ncbi:MAG: hypothetical protein LKF48_03230 [Prevotella sp.]|jgi:hypothetical protein|nr:hypothetical protein [Prevotella sp.]MCH4182165.1 hypothetical protein [Prevotella sp.]MCH4212905.1 hypothetical protein [Prevotella sp.]MCH4241035.1 hypothetical protein [Prevotella sp.]